MSKPEKHRFTFLLPQRLWRWIRVAAAVEGISAGEWVRRLIEEEERRR